MVPADLRLFDEPHHGLPDLRDTEMALLQAPALSAAAARLASHIVRELERPAGNDG